MFPNAISEVISELKSVRESSERISGGPQAFQEDVQDPFLASKNVEFFEHKNDFCRKFYN
jgi:hypothetical protein